MADRPIHSQVACTRCTDPTAHHIFLMLAVDASPGTSCWPSIERLAMRTGRSEKVVRRAIHRLERDGLLEVEERRGRSSVYHLKPQPRELVTPPAHGRGDSRTGPPSYGRGGGRPREGGLPQAGGEGTRKNREEPSRSGVGDSPTVAEDARASTGHASRAEPDDARTVAQKPPASKQGGGARQQHFCIRHSRCPNHRVVDPGDMEDVPATVLGAAHYRGRGQPCTACYNEGWRGCKCGKPIKGMDACSKCRATHDERPLSDDEAKRVWADLQRRRQGQCRSADNQEDRP